MYKGGIGGQGLILIPFTRSGDQRSSALAMVLEKKKRWFAPSREASTESELLAAGLLAGLLPAMRCYRRSLSDGLSPEMGS